MRLRSTKSFLCRLNLIAEYYHVVILNRSTSEENILVCNRLRATCTNCVVASVCSFLFMAILNLITMGNDGIDTPS